MAFPRVQDENSNTNTTNSTSHTIDLPSNIQAGELLLAFIACDSEETFSWPAGWTEEEDYSAGGNSVPSISVASRIASGTEGASITASTAGSETSCCHSYRISSFDTDTPFELATPVDGNDANPNPPNLQPSGGARDYLWIAYYGQDSNDQPTGGPGSYTDVVQLSTGTGGGECGAGIARRELNAASENPGTFSLDGTDNWTGLTIAVFPEPELNVPVFQADTETTATLASDITISFPSGTAENDLLIAAVQVNEDTTWNTPSGWTELQTSLASTGGAVSRVSVFSRFAPASGSDETFDHNGSGFAACVGYMARITGHDPASAAAAVDASSINAVNSGTSFTPGMTVAGDHGRLYLCGAMALNSSGTWTNTSDPGPDTEVADFNASPGTACAYETTVGVGGENQTMTASGATTGSAWAVMVQCPAIPASTAPTVRDHSEDYSNTGVTALITDMPTSAVAGNLWVAVVSVTLGSSVTLSAPSGWTTLYTDDNNGTDDFTVGIYAREVPTSPPSTYTWTTDLNVGFTAIVVELQSVWADGEDATDAIERATSLIDETDQTSWPTNPTTPVNTGRQMITFYGSDFDGTAESISASGADAEIAEVDGAGNDQSVSAAYRETHDSGAYTLTATSTLTRNYNGYCLVVAGQPPTGTVVKDILGGGIVPFER